ncbi:uncharacterized protein LOC115875239 [Sitophilus oryzae]|uniref:Uncharacterized protein LOC115875239 n=1 Tax=Sitophilus oryzae TaxID=7048 RepID=A0A6J2X6I4_SITOR|nr:uncharacterized protein LOC115875239 [Sitophilus oryzae]
MFKNTLALLLFVLACQSYADSDQEKPVENIVDYIKNAYHTLLQKVEEVIEDSNSTLNSALNELRDVATDVELAVKYKINGTFAQFQEEMDKINEMAEERGIDIENCRNYELELNQLPNKILDEVLKCTTSIIDQVQVNATTALNKASQIVQDFDSIETKINECSTTAKPNDCYNKLLAKLEMDVIDGPKQIEKYIQQAVKTITESKESIQQCDTNVVKSIPEQAAEILDDFALCLLVDHTNHV